MKSIVLLHTAVLADIFAALIISANRASAEYLTSGIASAQNLPLASAIMVVILLAEFFIRKKIHRSAAAPGESKQFLIIFLFLFLPSAALLFCSFYLPPVQENSSEIPTVLAYIAVMVQFSAATAAAFSKLPTSGKVFAFFIFLCGVCTFTGFIYTFYSPQTFSGNSKADAAIVLGASVWGKHTPSPLLRGRLDEAIALFKSGQVKRIVATGGTKRFGTVESEVQAWYLKENGVPDSDIIVEHNTFCTYEQAVFVKRALMDSLGMKKLLVVTDDWHLPRALLMCRWGESIPNGDVAGAASNYKMSLPSEMYSRIRESVAIQAFLLFGA